MRTSSGDARLDDVLGGGLLPNTITLIMGAPGSGKTILAHQYAFANATEERPAVYASTVSEPLEKIVRFGQTLSFFDVQAVGRGVFYEDLGGPLNDGGLDAVLRRIDEIIRERRPGVLVIDSFKALQPYAESAQDFRRFLHELASRLSAFPVTSLWVGEYAEGEISDSPEAAVVDAMVMLTTARTDRREERYLRVLKLRGGASLSGAHGFKLSPDGLTAFPRLADPGHEAAYELDAERISSGIQALDEMISDGYWPGASTLVAGPAGAGKTVMGLHFVFAGARSGEPGLIATLQENPTQLARIVDRFGWSLDDANVHVMYRSPIDLYPDEWVYELLGEIERVDARRVLIDSLGDLKLAAGDERRFREYTYSLLQRCSRAGVSVLSTYEVPNLYGITSLSDIGISHLSDNVVILQYLRGESRVKRAITVLKTRASGHRPEIREFEITSEGIRLGDEFAAGQSLQ